MWMNKDLNAVTEDEWGWRMNEKTNTDERRKRTTKKEDLCA
jgi:hypothetical protein